MTKRAPAHFHGYKKYTKNMGTHVAVRWCRDCGLELKTEYLRFNRHSRASIITHCEECDPKATLENEPFIDTYERIGMDPFKERIYG